MAELTVGSIVALDDKPPTTTSMPASLKRLVTALPAVSLGPNPATWQPPESMSEAVRTEARETLSRYRSHLEPASREDVLKQVMVLLAHYFVPGMSVELQSAVAADWAEDIGDFPAWAITVACRDWRWKDENRKPTPGQIRALCWEQVRGPRKVMERLEVLAAMPVALSGPKEAELPSDEAKARVAKIVAGLTASLEMPGVARAPRDARPAMTAAQERELLSKTKMGLPDRAMVK